jgi:ABC-type multidrug transport system fused ATPase/permease subunit
MLTYTLFAVETAGMLLRPFFLGKAVDGLLEGRYQGLVLLVIAHLVWLIAGTVRHRFDTRTYTHIYNSLMQEVVQRIAVAENISKVSSFSTLARELVDFLEFDAVYVLEAAFNILGSLLLLFYYDKPVVVICILVTLPVTWMARKYGKRMYDLNREKNDELEKQVDVLSSGDASRISEHYAQLRNWQVKISDREALNFGWMELMVLIVLVGSLLLSTNRHWEEGFYAGDVIGIYSYVLKFVSGLDTIPYTIQRWASLKDITRRMESLGA